MLQRTHDAVRGSAVSDRMTKPVHFGTDGWRGVIADDFTEDKVRLAAEAIACYLVCQEPHAPARGVCVGYDTRFGSERFARIAAAAAAVAGLPVFLADRITPTPALSFAVKTRGAAGGIMITSSHNPFQWNGVKYKASYGGSGNTKIMAAIEGYVGQKPPAADVPAAISPADFISPYVEAISRFADLGRIAAARQKYAVDCMYGAGSGVVAGIFRRAGVEHVEIRNHVDPLFAGIHPEPIEPHIDALKEAVLRNHCDAGFATDGDADRIGAVDEKGNYVDAHKIYSVMLEWMLKRKQWPGEITRAFNTTKMLDRIAARYGRKIHEHGIGFKYVCDLMLTRPILVGGEESGGIGISRHLPERDGLLNSLLLANVMADEGRRLGELVAALQQEYGEHQYGRIDLRIPDAQKRAAMSRAQGGVASFAGMPVIRTDKLDGVKFYLDNPEARQKKNAAESWLLLRASGTEPLLRIYAESCSKSSVRALLNAGREFALEAMD